MEEGFIALNVVVVTDQEAAEVAQPSKGTFDLPPLAIAPKRPPIVERRFAAILAMRTDQQHSTLTQPPAQWIAVVSPIGNDPQRATLRPPRACARHRDLRQCALGQSHFSRAGRNQSASQRNTLAVDHHHPLRAFAALGFADALAPFLAGAKLPSRNDSLQSSRPCWSNSDKNWRHTWSHTPRASHWRSRRQQVLALGYSGGKSRHRAPVLSTQRMPSSTRRLSAHGRPRLRSLGRRGSNLAHCWSDRNAACIPSFSHNRCKGTSTKYLQMLNL